MNAEHEFEDLDYVRQWAATADERRPQRPAMFRRIAGLVAALSPTPRVLELGCGPGALADVLLDHVPAMRYQGVDLSAPMLVLARERLARHGERSRLIRADLNAMEWLHQVTRPIDAVVTNQALHDLGSDEAVGAMYRAVRGLLSSGGLLVNAELVVPADGSKRGKPGKVSVDTHLGLLREAGFHDPRCDVDYGEYACLVASG